MTVLLVLFACFFTALMFIKMITPFLQNQDDQLRFEVLDEDLKTVELLTQQKQFYVYQLQEIEGDFKSNKLTEEDYKLFKRRFEREIIVIMRRLEEIHGGKGWEERVKLAYQAHIGQGHKRLSAKEDPRTLQQEPDPNPSLWDDVAMEQLTCTSCHAPLEPKDRFCSQCATPVQVNVDSATDADSMEARS